MSNFKANIMTIQDLLKGKHAGFDATNDLLVDGYRARLKKDGWFAEEVLRCN